GNSGALVKAGSTFAGWNTAANGSGTSQAAASTFAMPGANVTLYAQWTLIPTYSVTYSGNGSTGGTVPVDAATYANGATVTVTGNSGALVKTGYTFAGWNTAADGSGTARAAASNFAMGSAAVTLYAQWTVTPTVPGAPTNVVAIAGAGKVSVSFTAPANSATSAIASYTVTCTASGKPTRTATGTASPVVVRGMLGGVSYSCSVVANNSGGSGVAASALPVTPTRGNNIVPVLQLLLF
ncbi:MAG: InlB B-repeat-containing protein, partial [Pseudomonadota bacterium]